MRMWRNRQAPAKDLAPSACRKGSCHPHQLKIEAVECEFHSFFVVVNNIVLNNFFFSIQPVRGISDLSSARHPATWCRL